MAKILQKTRERLSARQKATVQAREMACNRNVKLRANIEKSLRMPGSMKPT